jgi:hypothetical protein
MEEEEYNDIVTYIQDQKYPQNANESVKRKIRNKVSCTIIPPSKAIVNAVSNITYRPLIEAEDTGR